MQTNPKMWYWFCYIYIYKYIWIWEYSPMKFIVKWVEKIQAAKVKCFWRRIGRSCLGNFSHGRIQNFGKGGSEEPGSCSLCNQFSSICKLFCFFLIRLKLKFKSSSFTDLFGISVSKLWFRGMLLRTTARGRYSWPKLSSVLHGWWWVIYLYVWYLEIWTPTFVT